MMFSPLYSSVYAQPPTHYYSPYSSAHTTYDYYNDAYPAWEYRRVLAQQRERERREELEAQWRARRAYQEQLARESAFMPGFGAAPFRCAPPRQYVRPERGGEGALREPTAASIERSDVPRHGFGSRASSERKTPPTPPPTPTPTPTPDAHAHAHARDAAARTIQSFVRAQLRRVSALRRIRDIARRLEDATAHFVFPAALDFADTGDANGDAAAVPAAALLYTPANAALHGHEDALVKLLSEVDAVESGGDARVRRARKALVGRIEGTLGALDAQVAGVWRARGVEVDGGEERGLRVCSEGDAIGVDISMN